MKTTLSILAGITLLIAVIANNSSFNSQFNSLDQASALNLNLNKGSYLASEFAQFKKENLHEDLSTAQDVSEKVWFKAFVRSKEIKRAK